MDWSGQRVLVTGGCSFIGSHLVEALVARGACVRVVDNLSSGRLDNLAKVVSDPAVEVIEEDLLQPGVTEQAMDGIQRVFHLAADHGGRGYIDLHQAACATNLALDGLVIRAAQRAGVEHLTYASSGCVYPTSLQADPSAAIYLTEDLVEPPYEADGMYGWAKLMGELTLAANAQDHGFRSAVVRYFTVYGERCTESHAVIAMIARARAGEDPFVVWGTGEQIRNWTYVGDIVEGTLRASEYVDDATPVNLGTTERIRVLDAARMILEGVGHRAEIVCDPDRPTGPYNRVADHRRARTLLDWPEPLPFVEGLERTIDWYLREHDVDQARRSLASRQTER